MRGQPLSFTNGIRRQSMERNKSSKGSHEDVLLKLLYSKILPDLDYDGKADRMPQAVDVPDDD